VLSHNPLIAGARALLYYTGFYLATVLYSVVCLTLGAALPLKPRFKVVTQINFFYVFWLRVCCGVKLRIKGTENLPKDQAYVVVANHQSELETIFLQTIVRPQCVVLKKELLKIPFFGWCLALLKPIALDRSQKRGALKQLLLQGKSRLVDDEVPVVIFPQGTRVPVGQDGKFNKGGAMLAVSASVPMIPLAHNAGVCWPGKGFLKYPGVVEIEIGEPISTVDASVDEVHEQAVGWLVDKMKAMPDTP
jgi:1-acyl-sn-glycerol-3-phosphate acyltransferase